MSTTYNKIFEPHDIGIDKHLNNGKNATSKSTHSNNIP